MLDNPINGILEATEMITRCPPASLNKYIGCLFALPAAKGARVRTVPDGCASIVIEFRPAESPRCLLGGPRLQPACYEPLPMTDVIGVRLHPGVAFALVRTPICSLVERREPLARFMAPAAKRLQRKMANAQSVEARFDLFESFLEEHLAGVVIDGRVSQALQTITESSGEARLCDVASHCGISLRQLERLMLRWVGIPPKRLARIARFQALLGTVADDPPPLWTPVAAEHYADQSQLIREFSEFAGKSPRRYFADRSADSRVARCP
jgi:AraC-like DNA-binding protein